MRLLRRLRRIDPLLVLLVAVVVGVTFLVFTVPAGNLLFKTCWNPDGELKGVMTCPNDVPGEYLKEVGFAYALNWSIVFIIVFPAFLYFAVKTVQSSREALVRLLSSDMLVDAAFDTLTMADFQPLIKSRLVGGAWVILFLGFLTTVVLVIDFNDVVLHFYQEPVTIKNIPLSDPSAEVDWSIAAPACRAFIDESTECTKLSGMIGFNLVFAAAAYVALPWFGAIATCSFLVYFALFATMFISRDFKRRKYNIIPDLDSKDPRRGFDILENLFFNAITASFLAFAFGFLVVLQNVYLRTNKHTIVEMVTDFRRLLDFVPTLNNIGVMAIGGLIAGVIVIAVFLVLKGAAEDGRQTVLSAIERGDPNVAKVMRSASGHLSTTYVTRMLGANFVYWPFKWPRINALLVALGIAVVSLWFVTIGLYLVLAGLVVVAVQTWLRRHAEAPHRVLMGVANPPLTDPLPRLLEEMGGVNAAMDAAPRLPKGSAFKSLPAMRQEELQVQLDKFRPSVLHFSGHGGRTGIILHEQYGPTILEADELKALLKNSGVRLLVLNCCHSDSYGADMLEAVEAVVSVTTEVYDRPAYAFGVAFHKALVDGSSVASAVEDAARSAIAETENDSPIEDVRRADFSFIGSGDLTLVRP